MFLKHGAHEFPPVADDAEFQSARSAANDAEASTYEAERPPPRSVGTGCGGDGVEAADSVERFALDFAIGSL